MTLAEATSQYWRYCQHYEALPAHERESFLAFSVGPLVATHTSQHLRRLLQRLLARQPVSITG